MESNLAHKRWMVKLADSRVKQGILRMLEWYAQSQHAWALDIWHDDHCLSQGCDPDTFEEVHLSLGISIRTIAGKRYFRRCLSFVGLAERSQSISAISIRQNWITTAQPNIHALYLECDRARKFMVSESQRRMLERICTIR